MSRLIPLFLATVLASTVLAGTESIAVGVAQPPPPRAAVPSLATRPAVLETRVIGRSAKDRPIVAYRLGKPGRPVVLVISGMHGNEGAPRQILRSLRDGPPVRGIDLWILPSYNPDGLVRHTRKNAHGVDLNRNFPYSWRDLDGSYESGPRPGSEPETKAAMRFLRDIRPRRIVSFHQPLNGVDTDTKLPAFSRRLSRHLNLPLKNFNCTGVCHGTMTGWYNHNFPGAAVTVEYGAHPGRHRMRVTAPRQLLRALGGRR
ncbi:M14 family zinc carboxypeptidase [Nocardioides sp.]|uniref:M14 family zinc carboxypeptidase n=1 Tax=Nocardioides sp. TaxID=35761 RepID=UPI003D0BF6D2